MSFKHIIPRFSALVAPSRRTFTSASTYLAARAPSMSDVEPDRGHVFDKRQEEWRKETAAHREKQERASSASATASDGDSLASTPVLGSFSLNTGENNQNEKDADKKSGRISSLIYGTPEGREMDKDIERSFSQVLARGKYVHSIVFHEVKPSKVDEYVELVENWYPKVANDQKNKVHLVGSWRTEVGDCDTFGMSSTVISTVVC
jgi:hypothetical protein